MKNIGAKTVFASAIVALCLIVAASIARGQDGKSERELRERDLGVPIEGTPGLLDTITDVKGVEVGYRTLFFGDATFMVSYTLFLHGAPQRRDRRLISRAGNLGGI